MEEEEDNNDDNNDDSDDDDDKEDEDKDKEEEEVEVEEEWGKVARTSSMKFNNKRIKVWDNDDTSNKNMHHLACNRCTSSQCIQIYQNVTWSTVEMIHSCLIRNMICFFP